MVKGVKYLKGRIGIIVQDINYIIHVKFLKKMNYYIQVMICIKHQQRDLHYHLKKIEEERKKELLYNGLEMKILPNYINTKYT